MEAESLALRPRARITASVRHVTGPGARDPRVLLNERLRQLPTLCRLADFNQSLTYDTYDGQNSADGPDWYALEFDEPVACNCVELTMGFPYRDGGWWTSLAVEVRPRGASGWQPVEHLCVAPAYSFADDREIGVALGYSRSHFSRLFRQYVGCAPSDYAARQRRPF